MVRNSLEIRPVAGALGAEIGGIDLTEELDGQTILAIRRAWLDRLVIFFRGQHLTPKQFLAFANCFGEVIEYPFIRELTNSRRSPRSSNSSMRGSISVGSGTPTPPISNARQWAPC